MWRLLVVPAQAGTHGKMGTGLRRCDESGVHRRFDEQPYAGRTVTGRLSNARNVLL
jgi:hypothetical protein